jgi:hypothetical protein
VRGKGWLMCVALGGCDPSAQQEPLPGEACRLLVEREIECAEEERRKYAATLRGESIAACREEDGRTVEDDRAALRCVGMTDCGEFTACVAQADAARALRTLKIVVMMAVRGRLTDATARRACATHGRDDAEIEHLCAELNVLTLAQVQAELQGMRDRGEFFDQREVCERSLEVAGQISQEDRERVTGWCEEIEAARVIQQLKGDRETVLVYGGTVDALPWSCEDAIRRLDALRSPWAGEMRQAVARICYVEIGQKLLPKLVAKAKTCEPPLDQFVREVRRYGFSDPGIDRWIARAERKCASAAKLRPESE